jgi:hypothetical protein
MQISPILFSSRAYFLHELVSNLGEKKCASFGSKLSYCNPNIVLDVPDPVLHTYLHIIKMFSWKNRSKANKKYTDFLVVLP